MRTVVPSREVYHLWASQAQSQAYNSSRSVSFRDSTAFSYAEPIGRWVRNEAGERAVLIRDRHFSVTTSKHQSYMQSALPRNVTTFKVSRLHNYSEDVGLNVRDYARRVLDLQGKAKRARSNKVYLTQDLVRLITAARGYCAFFGVSDEMFQEHNLAALHASIEAEVIRENAERAARQEAQRQEERRKLAEDTPRWLAGEIHNLYGHPDTFLRLSADGSEVETSRGARVPVLAARLLFSAWLAGRIQPGMSVGHYAVVSCTPDLLTIGCHELTTAEIRRFTDSAGWALPQLA